MTSLLNSSRSSHVTWIVARAEVDLTLEDNPNGG